MNDLYTEKKSVYVVEQTMPDNRIVYHVFPVIESVERYVRGKYCRVFVCPLRKEIRVD